jgi:hypothetical protein
VTDLGYPILAQTHILLARSTICDLFGQVLFAKSFLRSNQIQVASWLYHFKSNNSFLVKFQLVAGFILAVAG